jgi:hypothetical protein
MWMTLLPVPVLMLIFIPNAFGCFKKELGGRGHSGKKVGVKKLQDTVVLLYRPQDHSYGNGMALG